MAKLEAKQRLKGLMLFFPNLIALCVRLVKDPRVPKTEKVLLAGAIVYAIMPFDLIPDMIPFVGQIDDAYLIALTLIRLINHTNEDVLREHWRGGGDVVQLAQSMSKIAPMILPKRVRRVLSSRVERVPNDVPSGATKDAVRVLSTKLIEVPEEN